MNIYLKHVPFEQGMVGFKNVSKGTTVAAQTTGYSTGQVSIWVTTLVHSTLVLLIVKNLRRSGYKHLRVRIHGLGVAKEVILP